MAGKTAGSGPLEEFCVGLRQLRAGSGIPVAILAARVGVSRQYLYEVLAGRVTRPPGWEAMVGPLVEACTGGDPVVVAGWRYRHEVLLQAHGYLDRPPGDGGPVADFCASLKDLRQASGIDVAVLAGQLHVSRQHLYAVLDGGARRPPDWDTLVAPLVRACTGGDQAVLWSWRRRHELMTAAWETLRRHSPAARPAWGVRSSLPPDTAAFTGRDAELALVTAAVTEAARDGGVVAIRAIGGMPGVGKTALAVHAGHLLAAQFPDRRLFVDLHGHTAGREPVTAAEALAGLLAATGTDPRFLPPDVDRRAGMWRDRMAGQRALIVLDNAASGAQVTPLLPGTAGCLVLVTSRRYLADLPGAVIPVLVEPLAEGEAVQMFIRLAARAADDDPAEVVELTRLAGYLPLAVRLLAQVYQRHLAWTLADLAAETRVRLLTLTAEHASVMAAFEVSRTHLAPEWQEFLAVLGLNPAPSFDPHASAALAGVPLETAVAMLDGLSGEGLLTEVSYRRYGMHDLIRHYARRLAETTMTPAARATSVGRLLDYYQYTAAQAGARLATLTRAAPLPAPVPGLAVPAVESDREALAWLRAERNSLMACIDHAVAEGLAGQVVALTGGVSDLLHHDGPWDEAITRYQAAARWASSSGDRPGYASTMLSLAHVRYLAGDYPAANQAAAMALAEFSELGNRLGQASSDIVMADTRRMTGDYPAASELARQTLGVFRELGDRKGQAQALLLLGEIQAFTGCYPAAAELADQALGIYRELGARNGQAQTLRLLGEIRRMSGDFVAAAAVAEQALDLSGQIDDPRHHARALTFLANVQLVTGDYPGAAAGAQQALGTYLELGSRNGQAGALWVLGRAHGESGNQPAAVQALERALGIYRDIGNQAGQAKALACLGTVLRDSAAHTAAVHLGEALRIFRDLSDLGGETTTLNLTGALHLAGGDLAAAGTCHKQALDLARQTGDPWDEAHALAGLGRCARAAGDSAAATRTLTQALRLFRETGAGEAAKVAAELSALTDEGVPHGA
jgi:tetratricopeptide (TPR) repeat protein/transcriptional regulator with XRE-family HTH domain